LIGQTDGRLLILYGRVSGHGHHGHQDDLDTQLQRLQTWAASERKGRETVVLSDIGSGLNATRRQLQRLLKLVLQGQRQGGSDYLGGSRNALQAALFGNPRYRLWSNTHHVGATRGKDVRTRTHR
jgi:hypothetical protein